MSEKRTIEVKAATGLSIAGRILFANCAVVAAGAFGGVWLTQRYAELPTFVLAAIFLSGGLLLCLSVNYFTVKSSLKPLRRLISIMDDVQESGNLDHVADLGSAADPQIARLSSSFNTMLEWIRNDRDTIEKLSLIDPLTEVGNTRALNNSLETEIARIKRYGENVPAAFTVLIIDLDNFKKINDTFGHLTGDAVLRDTAALLQKSLRKTDTTMAALKHYRFGGDEFVIIAPHTTVAGARMLVDRLDNIIRKYPFTTHDGTLLSKTSLGPLRASIGYASYPEETTDPEKLMDMADKRMYQIKQSRAQGGLREMPLSLDQELDTGSTGAYQA